MTAMRGPASRPQSGQAVPAAQRNLVWLASYPKSGNTWLRVFLANYFLGGAAPVSINQIHQLGVMDAATELYRRVAPPDFRPADGAAALKLRRAVLDWVSRTGSDVIFVKTHALNGAVTGVEMAPAALTRAAIYILRDPRDVALSYARHFGTTPERAVAILGDPEARIVPSRTAVEQITASWSGNVDGWTGAKGFPVLALRYEDMLADPEQAFGRVLRHIGVPADPARLTQATRFSAFGELKAQEARDDFLEHGEKKDRFFHSGTSGQWRDGALAADLVARIERDHGRPCGNGAIWMVDRAKAPRARKSIIWLASYPKSGNTWTRVFLANYIFNRQEPMLINEVHRLGIGDSVEKAYRMAARAMGQPGFDLADYRQTLALRGPVLRAIVNNAADVNFVKTHNARDKALGVELVPAALTRSAIYILRNPLDMVPSYARHFDLTPEAAAAAIGRADNSTAGASGTAAQFLGSWSDHVNGWVRCRDFPVLALRYEDMQADPAGAFGRVLKHIGIPVDPERVARAVRFSSFDELKSQEETHGFVERVAGERFFHSGRSGTWENGVWRGALAPEIAEKVVRDHAKVMRRYGYLEA